MFDFNNLTIQTFDDSIAKRTNLAQIFPYNATGSKDRIRELQTKGAGIYFATNPQVDGLHRGIEFTQTFQYLSLDLDVGKEKDHLNKEDLETEKQKLLDHLKSLPVPPYGAMLTKNGVQPVWKFFNPRELKSKEDRVGANQEYQAMVRGVTKVLGYESEGDNLSRVIRWPGSQHLKTPTEPYTITYQEISGHECTFEEFNEAYPPVNHSSGNYHSKFDPSILDGVDDGFRTQSAGTYIGHLLENLKRLNDNDIVIAWDHVKRWNQSNKPPKDEEELKGYFADILKKERSKRESKDDTESPKTPWPASLDEAAYQGLAGQFVNRVLPHTEADPIFLLTGFLTCFGNILDRPYIKVEKTLHKMKLFVTWVGTTSSGRKGTAMDQIRPVFYELDPAWGGHIINGGLATGEGLINAVRDPVTKIKDGQEVTIEDGIKDKRVLIIESEYAQVLKVIAREHNILSPILRNAWDRGTLRTITKTNPLIATNTHISLICHITPEELKTSFRATDTTNGFGNRFLWFIGKRSKLLPFGVEVPEKDSKQLHWDLVKVIAKAQVVDEITFGNEAKELWIKLYTDLNEETSGIIGAMSARIPPYILRLSGIYALLDGLSEISIDHLRAAVAVIDYSLASLQYIFQGQLTTSDPLADKIVEALKAQGSMSRNDILNYFGRNISSEQISSSLELLLKISRINQSTIPTSGRYKDLFSLNSLPRTDVQKKSYLGRLDRYIEELGFKSHSGTNEEEKEARDNEENEVSQDNMGGEKNGISPEEKEIKTSLNTLPGLEGYGH